MVKLQYMTYHCLLMGKLNNNIFSQLYLISLPFPVSLRDPGVIDRHPAVNDGEVKTTLTHK